MITRLRKWIQIDEAEAGYSLVGISLFMVVLGIMVSAGITLKQKYDWAQRQEVTATNMALVKEALANYQSKNARLPCPASLTTGIDTASFGKESDCTSAVVTGTFQDTGRGGRNIRYGAVPVRTLGLPDLAMVDGWGHRLVYAVTEYYASGTPDPFLDNGAIAILDGNGQNATNTAGNIIYTVVSPGEDQRGAYTLSGTKIDNCEAGDTNCVEAGGDGTLQVSIFRQYSTSTAASNNDFTATMSYVASAKSYEWHVEENWSTCNCVANAQETNSGTIECRERGSTTAVADNLCAALARPPTTRSCAAFCWDVSFPACPAVTSCSQAPSTVTGTPFCEENTTKAVPDSLCDPSAKPTNLTQACPGGGGCGGGSSSSGGGGYKDTDGDGKGDTYVGDGCGGSECSSGRGGTVSEGGGSGGSDDGMGSTSSSGGGTMSVICTHFYRRGKMPRDLWRADLEFSRANLFPCTLRGYHFWGIPAVRLMRKYPWTEVIFEWIAINRAEQIGYLVGIREKPNYLGVAIRLVIEPLCFLIGIFVPEQDWKKVHADMPALRV